MESELVTHCWTFFAISVTKRVTITADNNINELYVNGVVTPVDNPDNWQQVGVFYVTREPSVIAVKASDSGVSLFACYQLSPTIILTEEILSCETYAVQFMKHTTWLFC